MPGGAEKSLLDVFRKSSVEPKPNPADIDPLYPLTNIGRLSALVYFVALVGPFTKMQLEIFADNLMFDPLSSLIQIAAKSKLITPSSSLQDDPVLNHLALSYEPHEWLGFKRARAEVCVAAYDASLGETSSMTAYGISVPLIRDLASAKDYFEGLKVKNDTEGEIFEIGPKGTELAADLSINFHRAMEKSARTDFLVVADRERSSQLIKPWPRA